MEIKIKLTMNDGVDVEERVKDAVDRKKKATETIEEAWVRIFGMKNSDADIERLKEVRQAMQDGTIGREPDSAGKKFSKAEALRLWRYLQDIQRDERLKEMVENTPDNYYLIDDADKLAKVVADLYEEPIIAVDTETTGVDYFGDDRIVGISLTLPKKDYHVYIPFAHNEGKQLDEDTVINALRPRLESGHLKKVLHNAKFDIHMFYQHGIEMRGLVWDTMVAMQLLNENEPSMALKNLATKYLKEPSDTYGTLFGKTPFYEIGLDVALVYAGKDTDLTWRLYEFQQKHLSRFPEIYKYYNEVENKIISVSIEMERTGFIIDKAKAEELGEQLTAEIEELYADLVAEFGEINFNSPAQLSAKLFDELKLHKHFPPNWKRSTNVQTLKALSKHNRGCELLLAYREKTKLLNTYIKALPEQIKRDGRVHGNFNQSGTVTGRFSSNNPNLQNQPYYARKLFVAPKGFVIIGADFSQQEPRLLAHFSGEQTLIDAYREGKDLYSTMASQLFKKPIEECGDGSIYRKMMKTGILAVMYGTGTKTLSQQLKITEAEAENFIKEFYETFPKVAEWIEGNKAYARKHGYVMMLGNERKRRLPEVKSKDQWERYRAERQATNAIIQGSASIQTKKTMIALHEWVQAKRAKGREFYILATIHDEVLIYAPIDVTREEVEEYNDIMINTVKLVVPNKSDIEIQTRWGEGYSIDEWFSENRVA